MSVVDHTSYKDVSSGKLDQFWWYSTSEAGSRQAANDSRIGKVIDPFGSGKSVQQYTIKPGDFPNYGGNRDEVLNPMSFHSGERHQFVHSVAIPTGFQSSGSGWNSYCDWHYPNNGPAQSSVTYSIRNNNQLFINVKFGPLTSDGTMGSQQKEVKLAVLQPGKYYELVEDWLPSGVNGIYRVWGCNEGDKPVLLFELKNVPTLSDGKPNDVYIKQGFYLSASDPLRDKQMFCGDIYLLKSVDEKEAFTVRGWTTGTVPVPNPIPDPLPMTAKLAVQTGQVIKPELQTIGFTEITNVAKAKFFVNGIQVAEDNVAPFEFTYNFAPLANTDITIGFTVFDKNGNTGPSYPAFPVKVDKVPVTPPTPSLPNATAAQAAINKIKPTNPNIAAADQAILDYAKSVYEALKK